MVNPRSSDIAHRSLSICNPISSEKLDAMVASVQLSAADAAVDVGCGKGELLLRMAARHRLSGQGVDLSQPRVEEANTEARKRSLSDRVEFVVGDANHFSPARAGVSFAACLGSTHALGGLDSTLRTLRSWTRAGGWVLIGEGLWLREPDADYLKTIGGEREELGQKGWIEERARRLGLEPAIRWTSSVREWDAYEGALLAGIERYVKETPWDPDGPSMLADQREFLAAQMKWGRSTMGFEVWLFRCP